MNKNILIIGFEEYSENMYPHLYEVVTLLRESYEVTYYGFDTRGLELYTLENTLRQLFPIGFLKKNNVRNVLQAIWQVVVLMRNICKLKKDSRINTYDAVVAIDHRSLNYVKEIFANKSKLIFWSLDIIYYDEPRYKSFLIRRMIRSNLKSIKYYDLIIVQDENRSHLLNSLLGSYRIKRTFLPVSLRDDLFSKNISKVKEKIIFIKDDSLVIMQLGGFEQRGSYELIDEIKKDIQLKLIIKGSFDPKLAQYVNDDLRLKDRVQFAGFDSLPEMRKCLAQADIGYLSYKVMDFNHFFITNASGQLVEFIRFGIPIISNLPQTLNNFVNERQIGIGLSDMEDFNQAVLTIKNNYSLYSYNCRRLYEDFYNLGFFITTLRSSIHSLFPDSETTKTQ